MTNEFFPVSSFMWRETTEHSSEIISIKLVRRKSLFMLPQLEAQEINTSKKSHGYSKQKAWTQDARLILLNESNTNDAFVITAESKQNVKK